MSKTIISVVGARPNFLKVAPLQRQFAQVPEQINSILVHTGQHYDFSMSEAFFRDLDLPRPQYHLGVGSATHSAQTAKIMMRFEEVIQKERIDWVVVFGDINSTLACALVCAKENIRLAHVEAGLRCFDKTMPEEVNRRLTDQVSDLLFVTEQAGVDNLAREGVPGDSVHLVGNIMIDELIRSLQKSANSTALQELGLPFKNYFLMTFHRAETVDNPANLHLLVNLIRDVATQIPVVFPLHPRTKRNLQTFDLYTTLVEIPNLKLTQPKGYLDFLHLIQHSRGVLSDSGGIQAETSYLGVPCLTFRTRTEQPATVALGTNTLVGLDPAEVHASVEEILHGRYKQSHPIPFWDGKTAERIAGVLLES